jgi:hypothetical protein
MAAAVAAAQSPTAVDARVEAARRVSSFRARLSGEYASSEDADGVEGHSGSGSGSGGAAAARMPGTAADASGLIEFD